MRAIHDGPGAPDGDPQRGTGAEQPDRPGPATPVAGSPAETEARVPLAGRAVVRRAPRYRAFVLAGIVVGALAAVLAVPLLADPTVGGERASARVVLLFAGVGLCMVGALAGAVVAVLLDRGRRR